MADTADLTAALETNRRGQLTDEQHRRWKAGAHWLGRLASDLREGRVESVEGAITKHRWQSSGDLPARHYIDVANERDGDLRFRAPHRIFDLAPDGGFVRAYFLPRSRWVVNLELLPDAPLPELTPEATVEALREYRDERKAHDPVGAAQARARLFGMGRRLQAQMPEDPAPPTATDRDPRPLGEAILGSWRNAFMTVTFSEEHTVSAQMPGGMTREARWSVDASGRLQAEGFGQAGSADAWVAGDQLTVSMDGRGMTFTRVRP